MSSQIARLQGSQFVGQITTQIEEDPIPAPDDHSFFNCIVFLRQR